MKILIAPNAFKGTLSPWRAARAMAEGLTGFPDIEMDLKPVADGGDGTAEVLSRALGAQERTTVVTGPLGSPVNARWYRTAGGTAILEMAQASGLALVPPDKRNPMRMTSRGTGELILAARRNACREIILAVGGSATVDGGLGALQALGVRVFVRRGGSAVELRSHATGRDLADYQRLAGRAGARKAMGESRIQVLCDVRQRFIGCARAFGPQKGARPWEVDELEAGLRRMTPSLRGAHQERGSGAAGGIAGALAGVFGAEIVQGSEYVFKAIGVREAVREADAVLTGEGAVDPSSFAGKAVGRLIRLVRGANAAHPPARPCHVFTGSFPKDLPGWVARTARFVPLGRRARNGRKVPAEQALREAVAGATRTGWRGEP